ncbi:MAG: hypothetical protein HKN09_00755, partial [Saprospiraceae bacterium]|nr:hypothetical protein [Saprospiraceae bacterium]
LQHLESVLNDEGENAAIVFLGDNIYHNGLPPESTGNDHIFAKRKITAQLDAIKGFKGEIYFVPGNHDWNHYSKGGLKSIKRQADFIKDNSDKKQVKFYPKNGCGDPEVIKINKDLVLFLIDSQWWFTNWEEEKKMNKGCEIKSRKAFLEAMEDLFIKYKNDQIVVLMHHPMYSNGPHGGFYTVKQHLFPLTEIKDYLWIPLPVIGSIYPIYRSVNGHPQDIPHANYQELITALQKHAHLAKNVIFTAGHEHSMQYNTNMDQHFVLSGSASRKTDARKGKGAEFVHSERGYSKLDFFKNGEVWLSFYEVPDSKTKQRLVYSKQIIEPKAGTVDDNKEYNTAEELRDSINIAANKDFKARGFKKFWLGSQYRDIWGTEIRTPVIDLKNTLGGLTPIKKGGGMASNSLRMEDPQGKHFILRSINKDYTKLLPEGFKNLKAINIMRDQNSASHPFGALMIPTLSKAAGIYYTEPKLVYLANQKQLGNYNKHFPEEMYLLEQRPADDWSDHAPFGNSEEIISYNDLLDILENKKKHFVDQQWVLKSRLFDLWIHDWDRHDDQWRWASFEYEEGTLYRPIPRDRDQAFYKFVGLLPRLIAIYAMRKFKTMDDVIHDVPGLIFNAKHFDRFFLNELDWTEWEAITKELQDSMTDESIEACFEALPEEVRALHREDLTQKLKKRRDDLLKYARKFYTFINKEVEISGTNNKDDFTINVLENGDLEISFSVHDKDERILRYERILDHTVTSEVRLYGLGNEDLFIFKGHPHSKIKIRIIGGEDDDEIKDESGGSILKSVFVYDTHEGIDVEKKYKFKDQRSDEDLEVNDYDRSGFKYNVGLPFMLLGYTPDDRWWIGLGGTFTKHGWRKAPYAAKHDISLSLAPGVKNTLIFKYEGIYTEALFGSLDFNPRLAFTNPFYVNYFGAQNEIQPDADDIQFNWVRMSNYGIETHLRKRAKNGRSHFYFGPAYRSYKVVDVEDRVLEDIFNDGDPIYERDHFLGGNIGYVLDAVDRNNAPTQGIRLGAHYKYLRDIDNGNVVSNLSVDGGFYLTVTARPEIIFATKARYTKVFGDPLFYQLPHLGNNNGLRGFRNERFRGEATFSHMTDLRMHLFNWNNDILPMSVGIMGGFDYGNFYLEDVENGKLLSSWTFGLSMDILDMAVLHPYYSINDEMNQFTLRLGFSF